MKSIDNPTGKEHSQQLLNEMQDMFAVLTEITQRHARNVPDGIYSLDDEAQQKLITNINPYFRFEFNKHPNLLHLPVTVTGSGMLFLSDFEGNILGVEQIHDGDVVMGRIAEVCVLPAPTIDCLAEADESEIPLNNQVLSPILTLQDARFKAGLDDFGAFQTELDLSGYQVSLPLLHYLRITNAA